MKIYRDQDPLTGRVYFFREGLVCSTCAKPISQEWPALIRNFDPAATDNSKPPDWDVVHKNDRTNPATHNCDDQTRLSSWEKLELSPALFVSLHDRLLKTLALNGTISSVERERQISLFAELLYEATDRGMAVVPKMTAAEIQEEVSNNNLVPPVLTDPI